MALFGSDMIDVTTPDGRRITVPSQLAAQFPGLSPVPPPQQIGMAPPPPQETGPPIPSAPMPPPFSPQDHADLARLSAPPPPTGPQPVTMPGQVPAGGPNGPQPITAPGQLADAGAPNTPPPLTNAGLAKLGNAGVLNAENAALDQKSDAVKQAATAEADQYTKVGEHMAARDAEAQRMLEERAKIAADNQRALDSKMQEYERNAKKIADTKIDRSIDHPILAAIGVALGAIGSAMKHESGNPALDMLFKSIDRKVAGQMQDLEIKKGALGTQRDMIGMQRDAGRDKLAEFDTRRIAGLDQAARQIETIKTQSQSERVRANADVALAGVAEERAKTLGGAVGREQQRLQVEQQRKDALQMHTQTVGATLRGQDIQNKQFHETLDFQIKKEAGELAEKYAALDAKGKADKAKELEERGLWDPTTHKFMVNQAGRDKVVQADKLEAQARVSTDPAQQQKLNVAAAQLRDSSQLNDAVKAPDKVEGQKLRDLVIATQSITDEVTNAQKMLEGNPSMFNRQAWAGLKTQLGDIAAKYTAAIGERVSVKAVENALENILAFDPDNTMSRAFDQGKALASMKELRTLITQGTSRKLAGNGIDSGWTPSAGEDTPTEQFGGKTATEVGQAAEPGFFTKNVTGPLGHQIGNVLHPVDVISGDRPAAYDPTAAVDSATEAAAKRTNSKGQASKYGLDPTDDDKLQSLISADASASHSKHADIVQTIKAAIVNPDRPSLANGILSTLRDESPSLYQAALATLTPEQLRDVAPPAPFEQIPGLPGGNLKAGKLGPDAQDAYDRYLASQKLPGAAR